MQDGDDLNGNNLGLAQWKIVFMVSCYILLDVVQQLLITAVWHNNNLGWRLPILKDSFGNKITPLSMKNYRD